ncbi:MAG TPA: SDR family oxidoreductase, partial [Actinomycetaceae bacterium]|nr:SDR family oxidoreductase [Actinomycetaceae bacterium]
MPHSLDDAHVLITGVTGFVGQAVLERLLSAHPNSRISVLVRPRGEISAAERTTKLLRKPVFESWRAALGADEAAEDFARRVNVISGDLADVPELPGDLDVVIHSASTVSFDLPIDEAFVTNVTGPELLYAALHRSKATPHVVHVSTSYVAGLRKGVAEERSLDHDVDRQRELDYAIAARENAEKASRRPQVLGPLLREATKAHRRAGARAVATATEASRAQWVHDQLVDHGRTRAQSLGWPDVYTFTKALGERVAEEDWAGAGQRLSIVRPTIIESSLRHPFPGWIDGFKVADPLIAAYGRGLLPEFPALADTVLDVIPVDFVVNATLAAAASPPGPGESRYYQVASGMTNPLRFGQLYSFVREYFSRHPLKDADGSHVAVPSWSFPHRGAVERALRRREQAVELAQRAVDHLPANTRTREWISALHRASRDLDTLRKFTSLYQPYTQTEVIFDNARSRELHEALPAERRADLGFDVTDIDWRHYLQDIHIPNVPGLMRQRGGARTEPRPADLPRRTDVMAVFDLQRTVLAASLVEQYLWVELATKSPRRWPLALANLVALGPRYLQAERRDRGDFIRTFMRRYAGMSEEQLRQVISGRVSESLRRDVLREAVEQIRAHRAAGHHTLLVTGEIDVFV